MLIFYQNQTFSKNTYINQIKAESFSMFWY